LSCILLVFLFGDIVMYVEPIYIESSNESSLAEVKQVVLAYKDQIVMEETFDKALEKILSSVEPEFEDEEEDKADKDEESEEEESSNDEAEGEVDEEPIE